MRLALTLLLALAALAVPADSQIVATSEVRAGCTLPGPPFSLFAQPTFPLVFLPFADGMIVMETESAGAIGSWVFETSLPGYSGAGYLRWNGGDLFGTPGVDTLTYNFEVFSPGPYVMRLWSQQNFPDSTLENDCWVRLDGGPWEKIFGFQTGFWNPNAVIEGPNDVLQTFLGAGSHVLEFSGRSQNFKIDRADIIPASIFWANPSLPQSDVERSRPVLGSTFRMQMGDPLGVAGFGPGSLALLSLGQPLGSPCGLPLSALGELFATEPLIVPPFIVPWDNVGISALHEQAVPNLLVLSGATYMWQGALVEAGRIELTDGLRVELGVF